MSGTTAVADAASLKCVAATPLGEDLSACDGGEVKKTLDDNGIKGFREDLISLTSEDILSISDLSPPFKRKLICVIAFFHSASREVGSAIRIDSVTKQKFDDFRTADYDPDKSIIPWKTPMTDPELEKWKRNVKPNGRDFPTLKDETHYPRWKEKFFTTLEAQGLKELIDDKHKPANKEAMEACIVKMKWLHKVLQDTMLAPAAKAIVTNNITDKDTRVIWQQVTEHFGNSMTTELHSQRISTHLTSIRFNKANWRGSQQTFLLHCAEQIRTYNEISTDKFSDQQCINFLNAALTGAPNLENVLSMRKTAKKAANIARSDSFTECLAGLIEQAQVYDSANTGKRGVPTIRQAHTNELVFEGKDCEEIPLRHYSHDMSLFQLPEDEQPDYDCDTDINEILCNAMDSRSKPNRRHARMNLETWKSLETQDQQGWDTITDVGKAKILKHAKNRGNNKGSDTQERLSIDNHELSEESSKIEVGTHQTNKPTDLLTMATNTNKTRKVQTEAQIRQLLAHGHIGTDRSSDDREFLERSPFTPEAFTVERHPSRTMTQEDLQEAHNEEPDVHRTDLDTSHDQNLAHMSELDDATDHIDTIPPLQDMTDYENTQTTPSSRCVSFDLPEPTSGHTGHSNTTMPRSSQDHEQDPSTLFQQSLTLKKKELGYDSRCSDLQIDECQPSSQSLYDGLTIDDTVDDAQSDSPPSQQLIATVSSTGHNTAPTDVTINRSIYGFNRAPYLDNTLTEETVSPKSSQSALGNMRKPFQKVPKPHPTMKDRITPNHDGSGFSHQYLQEQVRPAPSPHWADLEVNAPFGSNELENASESMGTPHNVSKLNREKRDSLMDRGANGGIIGNDATVDASSDNTTTLGTDSVDESFDDATTLNTESVQEHDPTPRSLLALGAGTHVIDGAKITVHIGEHEDPDPWEDSLVNDDVPTPLLDRGATEDVHTPLLDRGANASVSECASLPVQTVHTPDVGTPKWTKVSNTQRRKDKKGKNKKNRREKALVRQSLCDSVSSMWSPSVQASSSSESRSSDSTWSPEHDTKPAAKVKPAAKPKPAPKPAPTSTPDSHKQPDFSKAKLA